MKDNVLMSECVRDREEEVCVKKLLFKGASMRVHEKREAESEKIVSVWQSEFLRGKCATLRMKWKDCKRQ